jgi:ribonuclease VapC
VSIVLDASAVLAFLKAEPGADIVRQHLRRGSVSTVNLLEVLEKSLRLEHGVDKVIRLLRGWQVEFVPFDEAQALAAAHIKDLVGSADVSLADRACLALASVRSVPVLTADRLWKTLPVNVEILLIRNGAN